MASGSADDDEAKRFEKDTAIDYDADANVVRRRTDGRFTDRTGEIPTDYKGGKVTSFTYDPLGRETMNQVRKRDEQIRSTWTEYFPSGQKAKKTTRNGADGEDEDNESEDERAGAKEDDPVRSVESYRYENDGRLAERRREWKQDAGDDSEEKSEAYDYDVNGNRTRDERGTHTFNARGSAR